MKANRFVSLCLALTTAGVISGCSALEPLAEAIAPDSASAAALQTETSNIQSSHTLQVGQPASITIAPGADVETAINEAVYLKANASVVYIENLTTLGRSRSGASASVTESTGSGWVWDTRGYIVTNNHVVEGADQLNVTFADGVVAPAEVVGTDPGSDLAVIKVDPNAADLVPAEQGSIEDVKVGGRAIAIGNPFGLVGTMTTGIVSAIGRSLNVDPQNAGSFSIPQVIQTDAAQFRRAAA